MANPTISIESGSITSYTAKFNIKKGTDSYKYYRLYVRDEDNNVVYDDTFGKGSVDIDIRTLESSTTYYYNLGMTNSSSGANAQWIYSSAKSFTTASGDTIEIFVDDENLQKAVHRIYISTPTSGTISRDPYDYKSSGKMIITGVSLPATIWLTYTSKYSDTVHYNALFYRYEKYDAYQYIVRTDNDNNKRITISDRGYKGVIVSFDISIDGPGPEPEKRYWKFRQLSDLGSISKTPVTLQYNHIQDTIDYRRFKASISGKIVCTNSLPASGANRMWIYSGNNPEGTQLNRQGSSQVYFVKNDGTEIPAIGGVAPGWYEGTSGSLPTEVYVESGKYYWLFVETIENGHDDYSQYYNHQVTIYIDGKEPDTDPYVTIGTVTDTTATLNIHSGTVPFSYYIVHVRKADDASDQTYHVVFEAGDRTIHLSGLLPETRYAVNIGLSNSDSGIPTDHWAYEPPARPPAPIFTTLAIVPTFAGLYFDTGESFIQPKAIFIDTGSSWLEVMGAYIDTGSEWITPSSK